MFCWQKMNKYPNVTQKILLKQGNRIMILKHKDGVYDFPGGRLEWGENLFESLKRELFEELGFKLDNQPSLFHVWNHISEDKERHSVMIYYICELKEAQNLVSPEGLEILWLTKDEMNKVVRDEDYVERMFSWRDNGKPSSIYYCD